tara:strand:+ start:524 stop:793 length:270 start_codon:yes stop_codon:yes gene_type:complete
MKVINNYINDQDIDLIKSLKKQLSQLCTKKHEVVSKKNTSLKKMKEDTLRMTPSERSIIRQGCIKYNNEIQEINNEIEDKLFYLNRLKG